MNVLSIEKLAEGALNLYHYIIYTEERGNPDLNLANSGAVHVCDKCMNCTIHGREIKIFCHITNSRIVENENASVT